MGGQRIHERTHQVVYEVEDEPESDGARELGQCLLEHDEQQQGQTQTDEDGHEAGKPGVPVPSACGSHLAHQHTVEGEVPEAPLSFSPSSSSPE